MATISLLYKDEYPINSYIKIVIPTVGQIVDREDEYYGAVSIITAMPIDFMAQLDDVGIDFEEIDEYDLFVLMFQGLKEADLSLIFGDLDLSKFKIGVSEDGKRVVLIDEENDFVIDRLIHAQIADALRKIHRLEKNRRKPGNKATKEYMVERAKVKLKRRASRKEDSFLESLIISMVNAEPYKYDFEGTRELSIYQFNESVLQVKKKVDYNNRMYGLYSGTISTKDLSQDDLTWLSVK